MSDWNGVYGYEVLAWLEKQGEKRKINHEEICKYYGIPDIGEFSDGYHTFNGLYKQRMILFAVLVKTYKDRAWKSWKHEDGLDCFGGGWFIVGIDTPAGTYTYHYEAKYWDRFDCQILEKAKHWDGHDESDVERLFSLISNDNKDEVIRCLINGMKFYYEDNEEATWGTEKFSMKVKDILSWLEKQGNKRQVERLELKAGHWYICHRPYCCRADSLTVKEGEKFKCEKDGVVKGFVIKEPEKYFKEISVPPHSEDTQIDEVRRRSTIQVLEYARSLDTYNQYGKADIDKNIAWLEKQDKSDKSLYIRFGDIPINGKSKIYNGEIETGIEEGISVYPAFEDKEGNVILGLNLPITKTSLYTQQYLLEYDSRPCYLVTGDYVGKGTDGEPLLKNVRIIKEIKPYRIKQDKENNTYVINNTPNCGISVYNDEELKDSEEKVREDIKFSI